MDSSMAGGDDAAVHAVEAAYDTAWQHGDVEALLACLAEDAVLISPRGEVSCGHAEIRQELQAVLSGPARGSKHRSVITRVEFVTADVAIVDGQARIELVGRDEPGSTVTHRFTDVLVKKEGAWMIAHIRACAVAPVAGTYPTSSRART